MTDELSSYYSRTGNSYEDLHVRPGDEHYVALEYISSFSAAVRAESLLDVGAGTGRGLNFLKSRRVSMSLVGIEPSAALREQAVEQGVDVREGRGDSLDFPDGSVDVVMATGVFHHLEQPAVVLSEMCRVAKKAVFISDSNRYGQGRPAVRRVKGVLGATGAWARLMALRTDGSGRMYSDGDGYYYSYSIFDSFDALNSWGTRTFVIPTRGGGGNSWTGHVFTASHGLLVSIKEPPFDGWAAQ